MQCMTDCGCLGMLPSDGCPAMPPCVNCGQRALLVPGHVLYGVRDGIVVVHLHPGEGLHAAVRRETRDDERPRWVN